MLRLILPLFCFAVLVAASAPAGEKPNIIFILADDLAQGDLGCYGQKLIKTPHMDRLAAEGTRFTQFYCGTSVCAPSRSSLMTGLDMGQCPIRANREAKPVGQKPLPEETLTVAQVLKSTGYATGCVGKWGMGMFDTSGSPLKKGFDRFYGYNCQRHAHSYFPDHLFDNDKRVELPPKTYAQELIAGESLNFVRANKDKPFFLFYAITLPHGKHEIDALGEYEKTDWTPLQKTYAAMVSRLDSDVGRLMALLKELNLDEKTMVILSGDNGASFPPNSEVGEKFNQAQGLKGYKRSLYEGGLRQAGLARWPGNIPAGRVSDSPWAFWDFLPTAAELAGAPVPAAYKGRGLSAVSFLKGGEAPRRDYFYWELHEGTPIQACRFENWKAVRDGPGKPLEIYDLSADVGEKNNLAKEKPELITKAEAILKAARTEHEDWPFVVKEGAKKGQAKKKE